jgi:hypothetical protein
MDATSTATRRPARMTTKIRNAIGRAVVLGAAAVVMTFGASAAPANAAVGPGAAEFIVTPHKPGYHNVAVFGKISGSQSEAQGLLDSGHKVVLRVWGEDTFSDDLQIGPYNATSYTSPVSGGLEFHRVLIGINDSRLNEDWGRDELYVGARLVDSRGRTVRSFETNRVTGYF